MTNSGAKGWGLEVVRGREAGRVYPLAPGPSVLGNALNGEPGVDLGDQEGASPRRMAARQARVDRSADGLSIVDLDSPGGTFVNRQRLLPGQSRRLEPGDLIQLGAVQLKIVAETVKTAAPPSPVAPPTFTTTTTTRPGSLAIPFVTAGSGAVCRTWDDFLTLSAKSWTELRDELQTGRLGAFLKAARRDDLVPPISAKSPDERLDDWLARLPTTRPTHPDLDVHPAVVRIRATGGGGITRSKVVITNTGYRLLRCTLRLEPTETDWVRIPASFSSESFLVAETTAVPLDVEFPETLAAPRSAVLVIASNGGNRRVEIRIEPPAKTDPLPATAAEFRPTGPSLRDLLARMPRGVRMLLGFVGLLGLRGLLGLGDLLARATGLDAGPRPSLTGEALVLSVAGAILAGWLAFRKGEARDLPSAGFAGAYAGVLAAALAVAAYRAVEPWMFGSGSLGTVFWAAAGTIAGLGTLWLVPYEPLEGESR